MNDTPSTEHAANDQPAISPEFSEIMAVYEAATADLRLTQERLRERVRELSGELAVRNRELSQRVEELSALKNYLANILESIADGVLTIDPDHRLVAVNKAASDLLAITGAPPVDEREAGDAGATPVEQVLRGSRRDIARILCEALDRRVTIAGREVILDLGAGQSRVLDIAANPIRNSAGAVLGAVATFRDITEIRHLETVVRRKDRLAALGEMAAGVAHEIRNPLGGIELYASSMRRTLAPESREAQTCEKIIRAVGSLNRIVTDMLTFTRGKDPILRPASLERVAAAAIDLSAREAAQRGVTVTHAYAEHPTDAPIDPEQLTQAALNILLNAIQMTPEGGTVAVTTRHDGAGHALSVADAGPGVPPEIADKIFNPFFTTRDKGTGLGLAIVHKIVQAHGGTIGIEANTPSGAVFTIHLPMAGEPTS